jgi:meso-butanediol dehydrogenase / (S,S)-butanediol dehydrogenase / diacetyl reductase
MDFTGKVALVTGGTSGIGAATVKAFAHAGALVLFTGRDGGRAAKVRIAAKTRAHFVGGNLADRAFCESLVPATVGKFARIDILVNNAGALHRTAPVDTTDGQWDEMFAINVTAPFILSRAAVKQMHDQGGGGAIVNVASELGIVGGKGIGAYCATKGAVVQLTRAMALDHAEHGIRVNAVAPGEIHTPMLESSLVERGMTVKDGMKFLAGHVPLKRVAEPEEVARTILFLASSQASFVTGAILAVDGGSTAR